MNNVKQNKKSKYLRRTNAIEVKSKWAKEFLFFPNK
jgi:hypothetical protein